MAFRPLKSEVKEWSKQTERLISIGAGGLVLFFSWLSLSSLPLSKTFAVIEPQRIQQSFVAFYEALWVGGMIRDTNLYRENLLFAHNRGQLSLRDIVGGVALIAFGAMLLTFKDEIRWFALALCGVYIVNLIGFQHIQAITKEPLSQSIELQRTNANFIAVEKLLCFQRFQLGTWHRPRFALMAAALALLCLIAFDSNARRAIAEIAHSRFTDVPLAVCYNYLAVASFALFVALSEAWIWYRRVTLKIHFDCLDRLDDEYELKLKLAR